MSDPIGGRGIGPKNGVLRALVMSPRLPSNSLLVTVIGSSLAIGCVVAWQWRSRRKKNAALSPEVKRLQRLLASSQLMHPCLSCEQFVQDTTNSIENHGSFRVANFKDLAAAVASVCGVRFDEKKDDPIRQALVGEIGGQKRRHVVFCLCDGMGTFIMKQHLSKNSFLLRNQNKSFELRAVFPSTTPAALATLATAQWPGRHGMPGWDLREQTNCDYPGEANGTVHQLLVLAPTFTNHRTNGPLDSWYQEEKDRIFIEKPWASAIREQELGPGHSCRRMIYINAYNGDEFQDWSQGDAMKNSGKEKKIQNEPKSATDFSSWQMGRQDDDADKIVKSSTLFSTATIGETAYDTLGQPEGAQDALRFFSDGVDAALRAIAKAEQGGESTFTYLYSAHPDKHMHTLGTSHEQVEAVVRGIDTELKRMWDMLGNRRALLSEYGGSNDKDEQKSNPDAAEQDGVSVDASLIITADHGHVTVEPNEMIVLPPCIVECLEYANVGVFGRGRHAYLHCRAGLQTRVRELWRATTYLEESFILLTIEEAAENALFGPDHPSRAVRPRMGDFVAIATNNCTLVSPKEAAKFRQCRGTHGSLLPQEMSIPFVTCVPQ